MLINISFLETTDSTDLGIMHLPYNFEAQKMEIARFLFRSLDLRLDLEKRSVCRWKREYHS
jgi:hypothetical protein